MILGIGFDQIEIERTSSALEKNSRFAERILTPDEQKYCINKAVTAERVAGRFAGKEAVAKALGRSFSWHEVEILPNKYRKPEVKLYGRAAEVAKGGKILLTITHTKTIASAIALWVKGETE